MNRRLVLIVAVAAAVVGGLVAAPRRYEVDGISMGPSLLPGDVVATGWLPELDRWRIPRRFDRSIVRLPDGSTGLKRMAGLPGEEISLAAGDLAIDSRIVLKSPRQLAVMGSRIGSPVAMPDGEPKRGERDAAAAWAAAPATFLDDAPFATAEVSRVLLPVRDVGFAAVVALPATGVARPVRLRVTTGPMSVTWRLGAPGRYAVVAGRLDGHAVASVWPFPGGAGWRDPERHCLPPGAPERWDAALPWPMPKAGAVEGPADDRAPGMALELFSSGDKEAVIDRVALWRDILLRPAADGVETWRLGPDEVFLLGDFPSGSRDSRHFGPLPVAAVRHRVSAP